MVKSFEVERAIAEFRSFLSHLSASRPRPSSHFDETTDEEVTEEAVKQNDAIDIFLQQNASFEQFRNDLSEVAERESHKGQFRFNKARWKEQQLK